MASGNRNGRGYSKAASAEHSQRVMLGNCPSYLKVVWCVYGARLVRRLGLICLSAPFTLVSECFLGAKAKI